MSSIGVARRGRKPKSPGGRRKANVMLPVAIHERFTRESLEADVPLTDLGAYYMVLGWNATHAETIAMPAYLRSQVERAGQVDMQEALLAS